MADEGYTTFSKIDHEAEAKKKEEAHKELEEEAKKKDAKPTIVRRVNSTTLTLPADTLQILRARRSARPTQRGLRVSPASTERDTRHSPSTHHMCIDINQVFHTVEDAVVSLREPNESSALAKEQSVGAICSRPEPVSYPTPFMQLIQSHSTLRSTPVQR